MTSGQFHSVPVSQVVVNREERQRRDLINIPELADSISRNGLIHPIVITREFTLVAGERRLAAVRSLGHTHISVQFMDELDTFALKSVELEENIKRVDISWPDRCRAVHEYHSLKRSEDLEWDQKKTAKALGIDESQITRLIMVARELAAGNERVLNAPKLSTAIGIAERQESRRQDALISSLGDQPTPESVPDDSILNLDFNEWAPTYAGPRFNFIHCDFPYGIGADKFNQGAAPLHGGYEDEADTYWHLCRTLVDSLDRLADTSCHFMFWFSLHYYSDTLDFFRDHSDIRFDPFPLVWVKADNIGILPDPERGPRRIYETCLFGSRGDRKIISAVSNAISAPTDRGFHMSVKPEPVLRHFFRMFIDENSVVLDPTCGSGSALRAAESLSARYVLGLERNDEFAGLAKTALQEARKHL